MRSRSVRRGPARSRWGSWALTAVTVCVLVGAAGCSTGSDPIATAGVDGLVVPTPSPDPVDFVDTIDNPWFVLDDAAYADGAGALVTRVVTDGPDVAGVPTTAVSLAGETDLYAQDTSGNVWWLGREGEWSAGTDGAEAGLVMPARPRVGDGFRRAAVGAEDLRATVVEVDETRVVLEVVTGDEVTQELYTRGVGLELVSTAGDVVLARQAEGE
ncbi:hypothetical protein [Nocardioides rubriscoriae]|uniref:hypothetical protein n=1 Tax=Nocardioides rubriscoriae TaxID=642762 RepID=UPI0011DFAF36|nr:hypothetical protein [Nocardioides rubriscoriae]